MRSIMTMILEVLRVKRAFGAIAEGILSKPLTDAMTGLTVFLSCLHAREMEE